MYNIRKRVPEELWEHWEHLGEIGCSRRWGWEQEFLGAAGGWGALGLRVGLFDLVAFLTSNFVQ